MTMEIIEENLVRKVGEAIGYGRTMQLCEQIWKGKTPGGEHTVGPCGFFMVKCLHWVKDNNGHCEICCGSGRVTKFVAKTFRELKRKNK